MKTIFEENLQSAQDDVNQGNFDGAAAKIALQLSVGNHLMTSQGGESVISYVIGFSFFNKALALVQNNPELAKNVWVQKELKSGIKIPDYAKAALESDIVRNREKIGEYAKVYPAIGYAIGKCGKDYVNIGTAVYNNDKPLLDGMEKSLWLKLKIGDAIWMRKCIPAFSNIKKNADATQSEVQKLLVGTAN